MPSIIDYPLVLQQMQTLGLICNYHNSGAFGFSPDVSMIVAGWIGPPDETIRPDMRPLARPVAPPYARRLALLAGQLWQEQLSGPAWVMPMSHWAFELAFGGPDWLPTLLADVGAPVEPLAGRNNGSAVAFAAGERTGLERFIGGLLEHLTGSDFMLAFPGHRVLCMIHHHQQLWWMTTEASVAAAANALAAGVSC